MFQDGRFNFAYTAQAGFRVSARRSYFAQPSKLSHTPQSPGTWPKEAALYYSFESLIPILAILTPLHKINCYREHQILPSIRVAVPRRPKNATPYGLSPASPIITTVLHQLETFRNLNLLRHPVLSSILSIWRFQVLLTLFPKFFSNFAHATCLLSVSDQYLAFDDAYHRLVLYSQKVRLMVRPL